MPDNARRRIEARFKGYDAEREEIHEASKWLLLRRAHRRLWNKQNGIGSRGVTVNNVQPGPIDTELNPASGDWAVPQKAATALDRYGRADEIAAMVASVAGPESSYITGANLTVDGGMNA
jgi:NAD(P)-dependent dehydrogenase (short-subunit alcohol dehydrogenase family)